MGSSISIFYFISIARFFKVFWGCTSPLLLPCVHRCSGTLAWILIKNGKVIPYFSKTSGGSHPPFLFTTCNKNKKYFRATLRLFSSMRLKLVKSEQQNKDFSLRKSLDLSLRLKNLRNCPTKLNRLNLRRNVVKNLGNCKTKNRFETN